MKLNKILLLSLLSAGALFTACSEDDNYEWGKPASNNMVSFANEENLVLGFEENTFDVELVRVGKDLPALTVPIKVLDAPDFCQVPTSVSFAQGDTAAVVKVQIGEGMAPFTKYSLSLAIDEEFSNAYAASEDITLSPRYNITILKEDYKTIATGVFHETVYYEDAWDVEIQYSELQKLYRIPDAIITGTHWFFKWSGREAPEDEFYFTNEKGDEAAVTIGSTPYYGFFSGINNKNYGPVYVTVLDGNFIGFDPEGDTGLELWFPVAYRVSAGSFGSNYEYIDNIEFK